MSRVRSATLVHEGGMRFAATTGTTRTIVYGDDHASNELSPVETLVVSLGACSAMDVISIAVKKRQQIDRYEVRVEGTQRDEYPQILTRAIVTHVVEGPVVKVSGIDFRGVDHASTARLREQLVTKKAFMKWLGGKFNPISMEIDRQKLIEYYESLGYPDQACDKAAAALSLAARVSHAFTLGVAFEFATVLHEISVAVINNTHARVALPGRFRVGNRASAGTTATALPSECAGAQHRA